MIGQTIGQYKVLEKLGEGGMGVVYKAHDVKLDRIVALKFLPHHLTIHDEERARFLQEARAASALNHPNVCVIHDLQEHNGEHFIVMEYIEGGTLREKLNATLLGKDRFLPVDTAINYAVQIGEAMQEAHGKGIVHRDVKAENIMVTTKGQIKVMDFGLAKLKGSLKLTRTSSTVGTLAYMAPEQLQGGEVDARSDIFSFGVVLYEMLTGITPFRGGHEAAMMYSILNEEPQPAEQLRPELSPEILHVLNRSLEKNPDDRYQSVGEMVIDLRRLKRHTTKVTRTVTGVVPSQPVQGPPSPSTEGLTVKRQMNKRLLFPLIGVVVLASVVTLWLTVFRGGSSREAGKLNPQASFRVLQIPFMQVSYPGLSQDGSWVAFPAVGPDDRWDVYFMNALGGGPRRVTMDSSLAIQQCDISPDGSQITYDRFIPQTGTFELMVVSSLGGISKRIAPLGTLARWRPDGERIGYVLGNSPSIQSSSGFMEFWSVRPDGSDRRVEFRDTLSVRGRFSFSWSPDGSSVAWIKSFADGSQEVFVHELATGKERQLTHDGKNVDEVCWTRQGEVIFSSNKSGNMNLWLIPVDGGEAKQITKGSGPDFGIKISADGTKALYYQYQPVQNIWIAGLDGSNARPITSEDRRLEQPSFSPDGQQIVFTQYEVDPAKMGRSLVVIDRNGGNRREITTGQGVAEWPQWSPAGRWIAFVTHQVSEVHEAAARVAVIDASDPTSFKILARGANFKWIDETNLAVSDGKNCYSVPIDGGKQELIIEDSTFVVPVLRGKAAVSVLAFAPSSPVILAPLRDKHLDRSHGIRLNTMPIGDFTISEDDSYLIVLSAQGELRKVALQTGRSSVLAQKIPNISTSGSGISVSSRRKEIVYTDLRFNGKLVMIEHLR